jgi:hypothetical protein
VCTQQVVWEVFAHEPEVVPGPDGEYVMYFTANPRSARGDCKCCRDGEGPCDGSTGPGDCPSSRPSEGASYMSHTKVVAVQHVPCTNCSVTPR